jgi:hypothetical protein
VQDRITSVPAQPASAGTFSAAPASGRAGIDALIPPDRPAACLEALGEVLGGGVVDARVADEDVRRALLFQDAQPRSLLCVRIAALRTACAQDRTSRTAETPRHWHHHASRYVPESLGAESQLLGGFRLQHRGILRLLTGTVSGCVWCRYQFFWMLFLPFHEVVHQTIRVVPELFRDPVTYLTNGGNFLFTLVD